MSSTDISPPPIIQQSGPVLGTEKGRVLKAGGVVVVMQ